MGLSNTAQKLFTHFKKVDDYEYEEGLQANYLSSRYEDYLSIENKASPLGFKDILRVCSEMQITPSDYMAHLVCYLAAKNDVLEEKIEDLGYDIRNLGEY